MSSDVILPGDRFEGPGGSIWRVVDPWLPIEAAGDIVGTVWIICELDGTDRWIPTDKFDDSVACGDFRPVASARDDAHRRRDRGHAEGCRDERVRERQVPDGKTVIYRPGKPVGNTEAWLSGRGINTEAVR